MIHAQLWGHAQQIRKIRKGGEIQEQQEGEDFTRGNSKQPAFVISDDHDGIIEASQGEVDDSHVENESCDRIPQTTCSNDDDQCHKVTNGSDYTSC